MKVWSDAWEIEKQDSNIKTELFNVKSILKNVLSPGRTLVWWQMAYILPEMMRQFETMTKLVCKASELKSDSYLY